MSFASFGLEAGILREIRKAGYVQPTPVQSAAIPKAMRGQDLIVIAQTGTGKTAVFVLPLLHQLATSPPPRRQRHIHALILAPTRELAIQISENIRAFGPHLPVRTATIHGGVDEDSQIRSLHRGIDIIVATPGRLIEFIERRLLDFSRLSMLVLDEADRMLDMGFLADIESIIGTLPQRRQTLMFSATLPKEVEALARKFQYHPKLVLIGKRANPADTVDQSVYQVPRHLKAALLLELLAKPDFQRVLVFTRMKDGANRLTEFLRGARVQVAKLHSSRSQEQRLQALSDFKDGKVRVLVATDIAARGIDIEGVTHVVNFDFPVNPEDYIHRIGRTGRAGSSGTAISLVPEHDLNLLGILELSIGRRIPKKRLKGFNYNAPPQPVAATEKPARRDWRKRTRELEARKNPLSKTKTRKPKP